MQRLLPSLLAMSFLLLGVSIAWACSVSHVDTATEITDQAEVIVRAQAIKQVSDKVEFKILEVLKGDFKHDTISLVGQTKRYDGKNEEAPPYNFVRRGGRHGDCFAHDYKLDTEFLLFLKEGPKHKVTPYWAPLAATNEEVKGAKDPWVVWVKKHLAEADSAAATEKK